MTKCRIGADIWLSIRSNEMMRTTMKALIQEIKNANINYTSYASQHRKEMQSASQEEVIQYGKD